MLKSLMKNIFSKKFIFNDWTRPIRRNRINIHYWKRNKKIDNIGDYLGPILVKLIAEKNNLSLEKRTSKTINLMTVGSILNFAKNDYYIWGSGVKEKFFLSETIGKNLNIFAVRGPLTRNELMRLGHFVPEVYGDPAILLPELIKIENQKKIYPYLVIPHFRKEHLFRENHPHVLSTLTTDLEGFITEILKAKFVISSSLHGIIISESYGVPCVMLDNHIEKSNYKYRDYYLSTNRENILCAKTIEEALSMGPNPLPDLSHLRKDLLDNFPFEIFE